MFNRMEALEKALRKGLAKLQKISLKRAHPGTVGVDPGQA